jgi:hypothetical protein
MRAAALGSRLVAAVAARQPPTRRGAYRRVFTKKRENDPMQSRMPKVAAVVPYASEKKKWPVDAPPDPIRSRRTHSGQLVRRAGTPTAVQPPGTSLVTTILAKSPMSTSPRMVAPALSRTPLPILGARFGISAFRPTDVLLDGHLGTRKLEYHGRSSGARHSAPIAFSLLFDCSPAP